MKKNTSTTFLHNNANSESFQIIVSPKAGYQINVIALNVKKDIALMLIISNYFMEVLSLMNNGLATL